MAEPTIRDKIIEIKSCKRGVFKQRFVLHLIEKKPFLSVATHISLLINVQRGFVDVVTTIEGERKAKY